MKRKNGLDPMKYNVNKYNLNTIVVTMIRLSNYAITILR